MSEKIEETKEKINETSTVIKNIIEGQKIERFKFTSKELQALTFVDGILNSYLEEEN